VLILTSRSGVPTSQPHLCALKTTEQILLEDMSKDTEDGVAIRDSQCGLTKGKLCLTNLVVFCDRVTA